jgi:uncharacterized membrane-anchored protein
MFYQKIILGLLCTSCLATWSGLAEKTNSILDKLNLVRGPAKAIMGSVAQVQVPEGYLFSDSKGTRTLLQAMGNPTNGRELGFLAPTNMDWFVVFEFDNIGFVKDDDKDKLDAAAMLKSIKAGTEQSNEQRRKMGAPELHVVGWEQPPKYNPESNNLEWAVRAESQGEPIVNYNTRLLGRKGVMEVSLVVAPDKMSTTLPVFQALMKDYSFKQGERYAEFKSGDKVARYGLAALITGGAAAVAYKTGLLGKLGALFAKAGKFLILGVIAVFAFIRKIFTGRKASAK